MCKGVYEKIERQINQKKDLGWVLHTSKHNWKHVRFHFTYSARIIPQSNPSYHHYQQILVYSRQDLLASSTHFEHEKAINEIDIVCCVVISGWIELSSLTNQQGRSPVKDHTRTGITYGSRILPWLNFYIKIGRIIAICTYININKSNATVNERIEIEV